MKKEEQRLEQFHIFLTEYEKTCLQKMKIECGYSSMAEVMRDLIINTVPIVIDKSDIFNLSFELRKIGTNLNQIAKNINTFGYDESYANEIDAQREEIKRLALDVKKKLTEPYIRCDLDELLIKLGSYNFDSVEKSELRNKIVDDCKKLKEYL